MGSAHGTRSRGGPASIFAFIACAVLVGVAASRWRVGEDYGQYAFGFRSLSTTPWSELNLLDEPGIVVVAKFSAFWHDDYTSMFAACALVTVGLTTWTIAKNGQYLALGLLLYVLSTAWQLSFNGVRQSLACAIVFAGHQFIIDRRGRSWIAIIAVAALFHISALLMVLLYFLPRRRLGWFGTVGMILAGAVALQAYDLIGGIFDLVKGQDVTGGTYFAETINPLRVVLAFAPALAYFLFTDKTLLGAKDFFYANLMLLHGVITLSSYGSAYIARFTLYTMVFIAVAVPRIMNSRSPLQRALVLGAAVVGYAAFWYLETVNQMALNPFRWVSERTDVS